MEIGHEPMRVTSQGPEETLIRGIFAPIRLRLHNDGCLDHALSLQGLGHNNNIWHFLFLLTKELCNFWRKYLIHEFDPCK